MISNHEDLIINVNKLIKDIKSFNTKYHPILSADNDLLYGTLRIEGSSILTNILGYTEYLEHKNEYIICAAWCLCFNPNFENPEDAIRLWYELDNTTTDSFIQTIKTGTKPIKNLICLNLIKKNTGLSNIEKYEMIDNLESLFMDYFSLISYADNEISPLEKEKFEIIKSLFKDDNISSEIEEIQSEQSLDIILKELNSLVGLDNIKSEIESLIKFVKVNQLRKEKGLPEQNISLHSVFYGPPGTGKTTIARLLARALKSIGILESGHLVETERSQLVAGFTGQTAIKTMEVLEKSLDGVLFIDEAYSLINDDDQFGSEAINTILKYMEDNRDRLIVIVAGYEKEMTKFIESNTGLKSRFSKYFFFQNYTPTELLQIFENLLKKNSFVIEDESKKQVLKVINDSIFKDGNQFGNARFIRNYYEKMVMKQFSRIHNLNNPGLKELQEIKMEYLPNK